MWLGQSPGLWWQRWGDRAMLEDHPWGTTGSHSQVTEGLSQDWWLWEECCKGTGFHKTSPSSALTGQSTGASHGQDLAGSQVPKEPGKCGLQSPPQHHRAEAHGFFGIPPFLCWSLFSVLFTCFYFKKTKQGRVVFVIKNNGGNLSIYLDQPTDCSPVVVKK